MNTTNNRFIFILLFIVLLVSVMVVYASDIRNIVSYGGKVDSVEDVVKNDDKKTVNIKTNNNKINIEIKDDYLKKPSSRYKELITEYNIHNYKLDTYTLKNPQIIVIHTAECRTLGMLVNTFAGDVLLGRNDIQSYGSVNVGSHFLIDTDGTIYSSMPLNYIARHVIGLNYTSIGIENVGYTTDGFTDEQVVANQMLIKYLKKLYPSIKYVIGHFEYNYTNMPHYRALISGNSNQPNLPDRADPNPSIMAQIRAGLD